MGTKHSTASKGTTPPKTRAVPATAAATAGAAAEPASPGRRAQDSCECFAAPRSQVLSTAKPGILRASHPNRPPESLRDVM